MSTTDKLVIDGCMATILFMFFSYYDHIHVFQEPLSSWLIVIGISWLLISFLCLAFYPIEYSIKSMACAGAVFMIGVILTAIYPPTIKVATTDEMGDTPWAEWILRIEYDDNLRMRDSMDFKAYGRTAIANQKLQEKVAEWNNSHPPEHKVTDAYKLLYYIPLEYAKEHRYNTDFCIRH